MPDTELEPPVGSAGSRTQERLRRHLGGASLEEDGIERPSAPATFYAGGDLLHLEHLDRAFELSGSGTPARVLFLRALYGVFERVLDALVRSPTNGSLDLLAVPLESHPNSRCN